MSTEHVKLEIPFSASDKRQLQKVLSPKMDSMKVAAIIAEIGAQEALDQALGKSEPRTLTEQRQHRVKSLLISGITIREAEVVVAAIFKIPPSSSRRLIEATAARFDVELLDHILASAREALDGAFFDNGKPQAWEITVPSTLIRKWLQEEANKGNQPPPRPSEKGAVWLLPDDTYRHLCAAVDIEPRDPDAER
ncbi:hypothetical protein [Streptomyces sp. C10]|uniref:hypothetical protein n=1 Tax=Streptomyces sp. C10 TaxID=531941 RepID=UPI00398012C9